MKVSQPSKAVPPAGDKDISHLTLKPYYHPEDVRWHLMVRPPLPPPCALHVEFSASAKTVNEQETGG